MQSFIHRKQIILYKVCDGSLFPIAPPFARFRSHVSDKLTLKAEIFAEANHRKKYRLRADGNRSGCPIVDAIFGLALKDLPGNGLGASRLPALLLR
jgi:hypothetical protein